jgi:hypothetical protein
MKIHGSGQGLLASGLVDRRSVHGWSTNVLVPWTVHGRGCGRTCTEACPVQIRSPSSGFIYHAESAKLSMAVLFPIKQISPLHQQIIEHILDIAVHAMTTDSACFNPFGV